MTVAARMVRVCFKGVSLRPASPRCSFLSTRVAHRTIATEAFGETLQFITKVKLDELVKRRLEFTAHASKVVADANTHGDTDPVARLAVLVEGMKAWPGAWSSDMNLKDLKRYLEQARRDPGFPRAVLEEWIRRAEAQIGYEGTRYEYAQLFGHLLTDWLKSKSTIPAVSAAGSAVTEGDCAARPDGLEKVIRKETLEQKEKLESLIFAEKEIDVDALEAYLKDLFSSNEADEALEKMRKRVKKFAKDLRKRTIQTTELKQVVLSVLQTDVLSDEKQATLKECLRNPTVMKEVASVINMQLSTIKAWHWPQEGVLLEPRRQLNGKIRFYLDTEIITCLLLHYLGMLWSIEFRENLELLRDSIAWKQPPQSLTRVDHKRRDVFFKEENRDKSIDGLRRKYQREHLFMCQLPSSLGSTVDNYKEDTDVDKDYELGWADAKDAKDAKNTKNQDLGLRFDTPVDLKQSLLHMMSADIVMNKALHGQCTVVRTVLEWFGPSLPFATITTILKFFGMPEDEVKFIQTFLACPIVFKDDAPGLVRVRSRGVPLSYMLSTLCGELTMFVMDFAVNQRANGLFLHRIHDDFWLWDADGFRCGAAWTEMKRYAAVAGLTFNVEKTGSVVVGADAGVEAPLHRALPRGDVRWGFLRMDAGTGGQFVIDQTMIDEHAIEMRRQLAATTSVFGWVQAYKKYMAFVVRNCGAPAIVYGKAHIDGIIDAVARVQRALFAEDGKSGQGSFVGAVAGMLEEKFGVRAADIPYGWYLWPNAAGGLELNDPFVDLFLVREGYREKTAEGYKEKTVEEILKRARAEDERRYAEAKRRWESGGPSGARYLYNLAMAAGERGAVASGEPFFAFAEFARGREERGAWWCTAYAELLERPKRTTVTCTPQLEASLNVLGECIEAFHASKEEGWEALSPYWQWVIGLHHDEMVKTFGSLVVVEPTSVPVGMVSVFKSSRMRWEQ